MFQMKIDLTISRYGDNSLYAMQAIVQQSFILTSTELKGHCSFVLVSGCMC